ncbi:MAG: hypothetical protein ACP5QK_13310, partial [Myxococcota bacterium]
MRSNRYMSKFSTKEMIWKLSIFVLLCITIKSRMDCEGRFEKINMEVDDESLISDTDVNFYSFVKTYAGSEGISLYLSSIQETRDGGYIISGTTSSIGSDSGKYLLILKLRADGEIEWQKSYGWGIYSDSSFIQQTSDDGFIITTTTGIYGAGNDDILTLKVDINGRKVWGKTYGGHAADKASSIQLTRDGGYILTGNTYSFGVGDLDIWILKLRGDGSIEWQKTYGGSDWDYASAIQQTRDGGYILAGNTNSFGAGGQDIWIL